MGGYEFARQYEWSTCKSQPNCLKRAGTEAEPSAGLAAVDFRAGLALLPFLPMSPGDFKLIWKGLKRGSLVQFDRGSFKKLEQFTQANADDFADMSEMLEELKTAEQIYRDSVPDITHNHIRLLCSGQLWATILDSAVTGWRVRNIIDDKWEEKLRRSRFLTLIFLTIGLVPFLGKLVRRIWTRTDWRKHYWSMLTKLGYLRRAIQGRIAEKVIVWHRAGRVNEKKALKIAESTPGFLCHLPLLILPTGLHRFLSDWQYAKERIVYFTVRPVRLYFNAELREQWLGEMITEGRKKHILSDEDAGVILSQINEPFIQKYLKALAVHICTLPVTQIVSVLIAIAYVMAHPEMPRAQAWGIGIGIIALFQVVPISPGSLVRGLYVLFLVLRERNFKDYNIAVFLGFFKMFYNWPLTIRRRMRRRAELRAKVKARYWHVAFLAIFIASAFALCDIFYFKGLGILPRLRDIWPLVVALPWACGWLVTTGCKGAALGRRIAASAICGGAVGLLYTAATMTLSSVSEVTLSSYDISCPWRVFIFTILSTIGAIVTELRLPDPDLTS
jgi:hypothetical protein